MGSASRPVAAWLALGLLALGLVATPLRPVAAEREGKPVHVVHLDPGALKDRTAWLVRVERGDTLSEIAKERLGSAKRTSELQRLNPEVDARGLRVGQFIKLPPRRLDPQTPWVHLFVGLPGGLVHPLLADQPVTLPLGPVRLFAVPDGHLRTLRASAGSGGKGASQKGSTRNNKDATDKADRTALAAATLFADPLVSHSPLVELPVVATAWPSRVVTTLRLVGLEGRTLHIAVRDQQVDGAPAPPLASEAPAAGRSLAPLLIALAGLALFGLWAWATRRKREADSTSVEL